MSWYLCLMELRLWSKRVRSSIFIDKIYYYYYLNLNSFILFMNKSSKASLLYSPTHPTQQTTTLKDQLDQLQSALQHQQKVMESQKKSHNQLYLHIKNLQQRAQHSYLATIQKIDQDIDKTVMVVSQMVKVNQTEYESLQIKKQELEDGQRMVADKAKQLCAQCSQLVEKVGL